MQLRPYQSNDLESIRSELKAGVKRVLYRLPTGGGKTVVAAFMFSSAAKRGMTAWFICHRRELIKQTSRTFKDAGISHGIVGAGFPFQPKETIQICGVQTLVNRMSKMPKPSMRVWDECHHCAATTWKRIHEAHDCIDIGVTATPERLDGKGLGPYFDVMVEGPSVAELISQGYLSPYRMFAPRNVVDVSAIKNLGGDFNQGQLAKVVDKPSITGDAIEHYKRLANGKRAIAFCVSVDHAKHVRDSFIAAGVAATHIDGTMDVFKRDMALRQFASGEKLLLTSVDIVSEGFDLPQLEVAICLRPTQSLSLYLQQVGRALRPFPGKEYAVILDHAGNAGRHGLPDDDHEWSLDGRPKKARKTEEEATKTCPSCWRIVRGVLRVCPGCGFVWVPKPREIEHRDGDLVELKRGEAVAARVETQKARDREALEQIARLRGYKKGWVDMMVASREVKRAMGRPVDIFGGV
jgi:superfamily II DNA or RNA helicase